MGNITLLGIDTAKSSFELYGIDSHNKAILKKTLSREKFPEFIANLPKCKIIMEACGGSHHWGRTFIEMGHEVKLLAPQKVSPFVQSNKNDSNDAKAIVHASLCPDMEFVPVKQVWQQDIQALHRIRERSIKNQTALANEIRGILGEYGIVIKVGINNVRSILPALLQDPTEKLSSMIRSALADLHHELLVFTENIERIDKQLEAITKQNETCQRLLEIDGIGVITVTAILAAVTDHTLFKNGRQFSAWLGLTPGHTQTGGKDSSPIMLGITKRGNSYLRTLLIQGAMSVARQASRLDTSEKSEKELPRFESQNKPVAPMILGDLPCRKRKKAKGVVSKNGLPRRIWLKKLIETKGIQKAAVAYANKNARIICAMLKSGEGYNVQTFAKAS